MKIIVKERVENLKHHDCNFISQITNFVLKGCKYEDDVVHFTIEISDVKINNKIKSVKP